VRAAVPGTIGPAHRRRIERWKQRDPGLDRLHVVEVVRQHVAGGAAVEIDGDRVHGRECAPHRRQRRTEPPLQIALGAGTEGAEPRRDERGDPLRFGPRLQGRAQPRRHRGPARTRGRPAAGVRRPHDLAGGGQHRQRARTDREVAAPRLAFAEGDRSVEPRDLLLQLGVGQRAAAGEHREHLGRYLVEPARAIAVESALLDEPDLPLALLDGDARAGAGLRIGQPLAREDEQRPPHRQVFHERPIDVQRALEVGDREPVDAGPAGEEDRGRIGGVQAHDPAGRFHHVFGPVSRRERMAARQPGASFLVGDAAGGGHGPRSYGINAVTRSTLTVGRAVKLMDGGAVGSHGSGSRRGGVDASDSGRAVQAPAGSSRERPGASM